MQLQRAAARGLLWTIVEYGGAEGLTFAVFLVLARMVGPAEFGLVSLALVSVTFVQSILDRGIGEAVIQRAELDDVFSSTAFWCNLAFGALAALLLLGLSEPLALLFREPGLAAILRVLAILPVATALIGIHAALLRRRLQFTDFAKRAAIATAGGGAVGIACALLGCGLWSLVAQQVTAAILSVAVIWRASGWTPRLQYSMAAQREILRFGASVLGSNLVTFLYKRADVWLIGYAFGAEELGYYTVMQRVLMTLALVTQSASQAILTPVLARLQHDKVQFRATFERAIQLINAVWAPLAFGAGAVAPLLVPLAFGPRWQPAAPLLEIMSFCAFTEAYTLYSSAALTASGQPAIALRLAVIRLALTVAVLVPATGFGLRGMACGFVLAAALAVPVHLVALKRAGMVAPAALLRRCIRASLAAVALGIAVSLLTPVLTAALPGGLALTALVGIGGVIYGALLLLLDGKLVRETVALVGAALGAAPGRAAGAASRLAAETGK